MISKKPLLSAQTAKALAARADTRRREQATAVAEYEVAVRRKAEIEEVEARALAERQLAEAKLQAIEIWRAEQRLRTVKATAERTAKRLYRKLISQAIDAKRMVTFSFESINDDAEFLEEILVELMRILSTQDLVTSREAYSCDITILWSHIPSSQTRASDATFGRLLAWLLSNDGRALLDSLGRAFERRAARGTRAIELELRPSEATPPTILSNGVTVVLRGKSIGTFPFRRALLQEVLSAAGFRSHISSELRKRHRLSVNW